MAAVDPEALLRQYMTEVWEKGEPAAVTRFAADDYRRHGSPTAPPLDRTAQIERLEGFRRAFPDITIELKDVVVRGDLIAFRGIMRATHHGEFLGIAPTGRQVVVGLLDLIRIENGRFAEHWGGPDLYDLVSQLRGHD